MHTAQSTLHIINTLCNAYSTVYTVYQLSKILSARFTEQFTLYAITTLCNEYSTVYIVCYDHFAPLTPQFTLYAINSLQCIPNSLHCMH